MKITNKLRDNLFIILGIILLLGISLKTLMNIQNYRSDADALVGQDLKIIIYTKEGCKYCVMAKNLLDEHEMAYELIDIGSDVELQKKLVNQTGQVTVPYVFIDDKFIGGYTDLLKYKKW